MAEIRIETNGEETVLVVKGRLTIENAVELKTALKQSLQNGGRVSIDLSSVTEMDLSALQLLCSAHKTSLNLKNMLELKRNSSREFKETVQKAGYTRNLGCTKETEKSCFWIIME